MKRLTCLVIFLIFCSVNSEELNFKKKIPVKIAREGEDLSQKADVFVPTHEWQVVKPEQTVPRGLHIRMNLETGNVEAKLLDEDSQNDSSSNSAVVHVKQKDSETDEKPSEPDYDSSELQEILKKIKDDAGASKPSAEAFRSYEEIKQDLAGLNFSVKTDAELIKELFIKLRNTSESLEIVNILHDLEYYIQQYDNALDFVKMGGFRDIILPSLNSTLDDLRSSAAFLLGSATQSNPKAQIAALELSLIPQLLRLIANDESYKVRNSALYALSCISRHFPLAQGEIVSQGGISALAKIFENESAESLKLQMKIVTLFNDFVTERNEPNEPQVRNTAENELHEEKKRQYEKIHLEKALVEQGFCKLITKLLNELNLDDLLDKHDSVEKVLQAMVSFSTLCGKEFNDNVPQLRKLIHFYRNLSQEEMDEENEDSDSDLYFTSLVEMSEALLTKINQRDEL